MFWSSPHISRGWPGQTHIEDACPCPQEPCGLVAYTRIDPSCTEHPPNAAKTIRNSHPARECPAIFKARESGDEC